MSEWSDLIGAVAELTKALQWPFVAFIISLFFRGDIRNLLRRVRRGKMLGAEVELEVALERLEASTASGTGMEPAGLPATVSGQASTEKTASNYAELPDTVLNVILKQAAVSPRAALMLLSAEIERELHELLTSRGLMPGYSYRTPREAMAVLSKLGEVPSDMAANLSQFWNVRNLIVHGGEGDDADILRAIDSGLVILRTLKAVPRYVVRVVRPDLKMYSDPEGRQRLDGVWGVKLETTDPHSLMPNPTCTILPSFHSDLRPGHQVYVVRQFGDRVPAAWYRNPDTGKIEKAWDDGTEMRSIRHAEGFWRDRRWYPLPADVLATMQEAQSGDPAVQQDEDGKH